VIYPSIDKLLNVFDSKYELVHVAARRSKEITATGHLQMPLNKYVSKKNIGRALEEIAEGYIKLKTNNE
jgi:DNA-directed RNA polymerase subunit omega